MPVRGLSIYQRSHIMPIKNSLQVLPQTFTQTIDLPMYRTVCNVLEYGYTSGCLQRITVIGPGMSNASSTIPFRITALFEVIHYFSAPTNNPPW